MTLQELFTTHDVVPVNYNIPDPVDTVKPIYINKARAVSATSTPASSDMSNWEVRNTEPAPNWTVNGYSETNPITTTSTASTASSAATTSGQSSTTASATGRGSAGYGDFSKSGLGDRAKYWMNIYAGLGLDQGQQIALVAAMMGECGLRPQGAVEKKELAGQGNTKAGWAHAGEGAIGFTNWATKKKYIEMYNNDPKRKGPKLSTNEAEYAKASSRHIADLSDEDHALITYHFYKNILNGAHNNFGDLIADFYLQKAGRGYGKGAGRGASLYDQALYTGKVYQRSHEKLGYTKAAQTNTFERTMGWAQELADLVGYQYS